MRILLIRHGDPDYEHDSLTEKGCREAAFLAERLSGMKIDAFYVSPLGRAQKTASYTLEKMGRTAETCPWLREFDAPIDRDGTGEKKIPWDMLPGNWTKIPEYYDKEAWMHVPVMEAGSMEAHVREVWDGIDGIIARHGYQREGNVYRAVRPNMETIAVFCHFGVTCVMLSHLLGVSPMVLWHGTAAAPTSVTTLITEERRPGIASLRMSAFGDVSHLYVHGEEPSFSARFCEMYTNMDERHD